MDQRPLVIPLKREDPRQHLVENDSQRPDVGALVNGFALRLLRRHVGDGTHGRSLAGQLDLAGELRQAEVQDLHYPVGCDEHVGRLDVAVDNALLVGFRHARRRLDGYSQGFFLLQRALLDRFPQALPFIEGHGDVHPVILGLSDLMNVADVGVVEGRRGPSLVNEPLPRFGIGRPLRREEFEGYGALEDDVFGLIHDSHPAPADLVHDPVLPGDEGPLRKHMGGGLNGLRQGADRRAILAQEGGAAAAEPGGIGIIGVTPGAFQIPFLLSGWPKHTEANQYGQAAKIIGFNPWISRLLKNPRGKARCPGSAVDGKRPWPASCKRQMDCKSRVRNVVDINYRLES